MDHRMRAMRYGPPVDKDGFTDASMSYLQQQEPATTLAFLDRECLYVHSIHACPADRCIRIIEYTIDNVDSENMCSCEDTVKKEGT